ncbi:PAS domain-containing sensor histidine kinase [Parabacteroides bouchesdurhonensis]|uniref:PAS domain-containing sensor histidine kinase n=1 Tax=Parabacteroides bouchesdurhonensis TaxID=1936995 RepID=UPI000C81CDF9|nr:ATP-binding protein [Parabacteroides bouchesdurhonensis]
MDNINKDEDIKDLLTRLEEKAKVSLELHELINTILDKLPLGVFVKDAEDQFNYLYWNHFMEEITGIDASDIKGDNGSKMDFGGILSIEERFEIDRMTMKTGKVKEFQGRVKTPSGEFKVIEVTKIPISLKDGKPLLLTLWRDITAKQEIEKTLKRTRILTKMALRTGDIRTSSIFVNPDSTSNYEDSIVTINDWSTKDESTIDVPWKAFAGRVHPDDYEAYVKAFYDLCAGKCQDMKIESRIKLSNNSDYTWRDTTAYVYERDERGRPTIIIGCSTDIQSQKDQELDMEVARKRAEDADKMKSKYLADMSHEIRTPLNAITGFAELMAFADTDEERMSYYEIIKTNNQLLMQLINDILDLSKIEAGAIKISYAPIHINDFMDMVYASAKLRVQEGVEMILEKEAADCEFVTDQIRLLQVVNNLVNNAIKNTKQGSITLGYHRLPEDMYEFYVTDTGIGIAKDEIDTLFERFVKLNDYVEGIGLGLAISKGLVTRMGGSIRVESELGKGSRFSFVLPCHRRSI